MTKPTSKKLNAILEKEVTETKTDNGGGCVTSKKLNDILREGENKPKLDRHGRIKVPHWGSDDEQEEGTVKAQLRKLPPKRSFKEDEEVTEAAEIFPWRYFIRDGKWVQVDKASTKEEIITKVQLKTRHADVRLGNPKRTPKGNREYPVILGGKPSTRHRVIGLGVLGGPYGSEEE